MFKKKGINFTPFESVFILGGNSEIAQEICMNLVQKGAKKIYGIDVGYGQTSWKIRNNQRK